MTQTPILIGCAHGTASPEGQAVVRQILEDVRVAMPDVEVREAYVDVHGPFLDDVIAEIPVGEGLTAVVVPLLLASGYHVYHDIANAVAERPDIMSAAALGPDARLVDIVRDRLREAHVPSDATLVLAAAGSSDPRSQADTEAAAENLRGAWGGPVRVGFAAGHEPSVADAVAQAHEYGEDGVVAVASFLLAPGVFQKRLGEAGANYVTGPLAPHPDLVSIIADRYGAITHGHL
ncbi:sirohydrochlorin chelatase [Demequina sp. TTPB684]|uniref:sirohydrochlorin chelatase n=1 Tax=unclassified Demequina TaxID=2620311 RepID=UPI001CF0E1BC|nr:MULTISPECIES: CbiX/SirB N-terminal domain-containing protein [unclassified Demequina]MCB2412111.1 sirohydrochlorin chelatase [Demequina sp. TTPB684]UPU88898.1 sirohydrochlorin chelatase [Demequina sp. TMPB413]